MRQSTRVINRRGVVKALDAWHGTRVVAERFAVEVLSREGGGIMEMRRHGRHWAVYDAEGLLVVVAVYKKGAAEVVRRLTAMQAAARGPGGAGTDEVAGTVAPVQSTKMPQEKTRRSVRRAKEGRDALQNAPGVVGEGAGHTRRIGTVTIHVDFTSEGDDDRP